MPSSLAAGARRLLLGWLTCGLLASSPVLAATPDEQAAARAHYERGKAHFTKGEYDHAISEMVLALGYERLPVYVWNIARSYEKKGDLANARNYYAQYEAIAPSPAEAAEARAKIVALEKIQLERSRYGRAVIRTNVDGARVWVDGKEVGVTPLADHVELELGPHRVRITRDGYEPFETTLDIEGGLTTTVHFELTALAEHPTGELLLTVTTPGAVARVDGAEVGTGPFERALDLGAGRHDVTVLLDGHLPFVRSVNVERGGRSRLSPNLERLPTGEPQSGGSAATWGWVLVGVGGVAGGVGGYLLADPPATRTETETEVITKRDYTPGSIVAAAGGVALITGIILVATASDDAPPDDGATLWIDPSSRGLGLQVHSSF